MPCSQSVLAHRRIFLASLFSHFSNKPYNDALNHTFFLLAIPPCSPLIRIHTHRSNRSSSSSSSQPFRRLTTIFSSSLVSATADRSSLSSDSVTFCRSWPVRASVMSRFSMSVARDSLTSRMRPSRSAASGWRIWLRMDWRASAVIRGRRRCSRG